MRTVILARREAHRRPPFGGATVARLPPVSNFALMGTMTTATVHGASPVVEAAGEGLGLEAVGVVAPHATRAIAVTPIAILMAR